MKKNKNVQLMYLIVFLQGFVFYGSIATIYREARGVSISEIFMIESIYFMLVLIFEVPWGWVADRFGYKKTLVIANFIFFISKVVFWKANGFSLFLLERVLLAIALSGISGCDSALLYVSLDEEENSEKVFGKYNFYSNSGFLIATMVSGFIIHISTGLAAYCTIIPYAIASFATLFLVDVKVQKEAKVSIKKSFGIVFKNKKFILFILSVSLIGEVVQSVTVFLNQRQYLKSGIDIKYFGILLALFSIIKLISAKSYKISKKFGQKRAVVLLSFAISMSTGCLLFVSSPGLTVFFIGVISGASSLMVPIISGIENQSIVEGDRATVLSIYSMVGSIIAILINPVIGVATEVSLEMGMMSCYIISLVASVFLAITITSCIKKDRDIKN